MLSIVCEGISNWDLVRNLAGHLRFANAHTIQYLLSFAKCV